jgi:hypothetical protein
MTWKRILKYTLIVGLILTIAFAAWSHIGLIRMYGGATKVVDASQLNISEGPVAIQNAAVLSPDGQQFLPNRTVLIQDGLISRIDSNLTIDSEYELVDGTGKYLIPGLTDAHVHLWRSQNDLLLYVANGVTQIRELIGETFHLKWREEIEEGRLGPDMFITSPRLGTFGLVPGWFMSWSQRFDNIRSPASAPNAVARYQKMGYDGIKVYSHLSPEVYQALCQAADSLDVPVTGHVPFRTSLEDVYTSSQSDIAHFEEIMNALNREFGYYRNETADSFLRYVDKRMPDVTRQLLDHDMYVTSSMWGTEQLVAQKFALDSTLEAIPLEYVNPGLVEWSTMVPRGGLGWLPEVNRYQMPPDLTPEEQAGRRLHWETYIAAEQRVGAHLIEAGVPIMVGTDANLPVKVPGFSIHNELESMVDIGMTPGQALNAATLVPNTWIGSNAGQIQAGKTANLVLLSDNPLEDIRNTRSIEAVVMRGKLLDRATLDQMLEAVREANADSRKKDVQRFTANG